MQWIADIVSSKYSRIDSVVMEGECGLDEKCIQTLVDAFKCGSKVLSSDKVKKLKLRFLSMNCTVKDDKMLKQMQSELLNPNWTNIQDICINSCKYHHDNENHNDKPWHHLRDW